MVIVRTGDKTIFPTIDTAEVDANAQVSLGQVQIYNDLHMNVGSSIVFTKRIILGDDDEQKGLNINIDFIKGKVNTLPYLDFTPLSLTDLPPTLPNIILSQVSSGSATTNPDFMISCLRANEGDPVSQVRDYCDLAASSVKDVAKEYVGKCKSVNTTLKKYCIYAYYNPAAYPTEVVGGLTTIEIVFIVIGSVILAGCIGVIIYCCIFAKGKGKGHKKNKKDLGNDKYVNKTEEEI